MAWIVGSERPLPRAQRRGGVIILGMLALAKRSVVADRVETLVKVGLGERGKVCYLPTMHPLLLTLARRAT